MIDLAGTAAGTAERTRPPGAARRRRRRGPAPAGAVRLYGRDPAIRLVRELTTRPVRAGRPRSEAYPVLVFEGPPGAGKTALLDELERLVHRRVPHARVDLAAGGARTVPDVLSALAFGLGRHCPRYGTLRFPRLLLGRLVMGQDLDLADRAAARAQVRALLRQQRRIDQVLDVLHETAGEVLTLTPGVPIGLIRRAVGLAVDRLAAWVWTRRVVLGRYQDWYARPGAGLGGDSLETLVDLNAWARHAGDDEASRERLDELLCGAFLADLRHDLAPRRRPAATLNAVVLLDNADSALGQRLLAALVHVRRRHAVETHDGADPLTVVATSRGALLGAVAPVDRATLAPGERSWAEHRRHHPARLWWLGQALPALGRDEVDALVAASVPAAARAPRLAEMIRALTGGHPESTRLLAAAVAERVPEPVELDDVLAQPEPGGPRPHRLTVEARLVRRLLLDEPDPALDADLVTCAATRAARQVRDLAEPAGLLAGLGPAYIELLVANLWGAGDPAGPALARRLLLRRLAVREDDHPAAWNVVHGRLEEIGRDAGDEAGELHHALAAGRLAAVTARLDEHLAAAGELGPWLDLLHQVTTAPRRRPARDPLTAEVARLASRVPEAHRPLARLVAGLWIASDPLSASRRRLLHLALAAGFQDVAARTDDADGRGLREVQHHQARATRWE